MDGVLSMGRWSPKSNGQNKKQNHYCYAIKAKALKPCNYNSENDFYTMPILIRFKSKVYKMSFQIKIEMDSIVRAKEQIELRKPDNRNKHIFCFFSFSFSFFYFVLDFGF